MSKSLNVQFGVQGLGSVPEEEDQIDSSAPSKVDVSNMFGGECKPAVKRTPSNTYDQVQVNGLNATKMKKPQAKKPVMMTGGTTTEAEDDDPMGLIPSVAANPSKFKEVEIKSGQFPDDETAESGTGMKTHEMSCGTDDPPVEKKEPSLSEILKIAKAKEEAKKMEQSTEDSTN